MALCLTAPALIRSEPFAISPFHCEPHQIMHATRCFTTWYTIPPPTTTSLWPAFVSTILCSEPMPLSRLQPLCLLLYPTPSHPSSGHPLPKSNPLNQYTKLYVTGLQDQLLNSQGLRKKYKRILTLLKKIIFCLKYSYLLLNRSRVQQALLRGFSIWIINTSRTTENYVEFFLFLILEDFFFSHRLFPESFRIWNYVLKKCRGLKFSF